MNREKIRATTELLDLTGETALVTGASGNIGAVIAERLAEAGAAVIVHYHTNKAAADTLADRLGGEAVQADLSDESAVVRLFAAITPSLVVNNAAAQPVTGLGDMTHAQWRAVMSANLDSAFLACPWTPPSGW